ncbi:MAG: hypothetical protein Q9173_000786 [Seirophora scorigena]
MDDTGRSQSHRKKDDQIRSVTASMLSAGNGRRSGQPQTPIMRNTVQPAATSITERLLRLLDEYDQVNQHPHTGGNPSLLAKPSNQNEQIVESLLRIQREKAASHIHALIRGVCMERPMAGSEAEKISSSLGVTQNDENGSPDGLSGRCWNQITNSACRGVRRMVKGFPEQ